MTPAEPVSVRSGSGPGRARRIVRTAVCAVAALLTALLGVGAVNLLTASDSTPGDRLAALVHLPWLVVGWSLAFAALVRRPVSSPAALQQLVAMLVGLYLTGLLVPDEGDYVFAVGFTVVVGAVVMLYPDRRAAFRAGAHGPSPLLVPFALLSAAPLSVYALDVVDLYISPTEGPFYLGVAGTALSVPLVALVAGLQARGMRLPAWSAGVMGASISAGSLIWSDDPGALPGWAAASGLVAAAAFVAAAEWEQRRTAAARSASEHRSATDDRAEAGR